MLKAFSIYSEIINNRLQCTILVKYGKSVSEVTSLKQLRHLEHLFRVLASRLHRETWACFGRNLNVTSVQ